ncbi:MAG: GNAT family N-acetyltransferase [Spirochaetota bacterium]
MSVVVSPVSTQKDLMAFIKLPWKLYRDDPNWVPPLIADQKTLLSREKNPFFQHATVEYFLAEKDGEIAGRIAAIHDPSYIAFQDENIGFFGFYESIDDLSVADALFAAARSWLAKRNVVAMRGPTNPGTNDTLGLLVDAFDRPPMVMMPYNPPSYPRLFEAAGLVKAKDLYAYWLSAERMGIDRLERLVTTLKKRHNLSLRPINLRKLEDEVELIKLVYNDAWERNWGFVPWTDAELDHLGAELKPVVDPNLVLFAYKDDDLAGFSLTLPDLYQALIHVKSGRLLPVGIFKLLYWQRKINQVRVLAMGIRHKYRGLGIDALFYHQTLRYAETKNRQRGELSWILEDNHNMRAVLEKLGAEVYKTYRLYDQPILPKGV